MMSYVSIFYFYNYEKCFLIFECMYVCMFPGFFVLKLNKMIFYKNMENKKTQNRKNELKKKTSETIETKKKPMNNLEENKKSVLTEIEPMSVNGNQTETESMSINENQTEIESMTINENQTEIESMTINENQTEIESMTINENQNEPHTENCKKNKTELSKENTKTNSKKNISIPTIENDEMDTDDESFEEIDDEDERVNADDIIQNQIKTQPNFEPKFVQSAQFLIKLFKRVTRIECEKKRFLTTFIKFLKNYKEVIMLIFYDEIENGENPDKFGIEVSKFLKDPELLKNDIHKIMFLNNMFQNEKTEIEGTEIEENNIDDFLDFLIREYLKNHEKMTFEKYMDEYLKDLQSLYKNIIKHRFKQTSEDLEMTINENIFTSFSLFTKWTQILKAPSSSFFYLNNPNFHYLSNENKKYIMNCLTEGNPNKNY